MTQLDRIEDRQIDMDERVRKIETTLAEMRGEKRGEGRAAATIRYTVTAVIAAVAGFGGGKLPGLN